MSWLKLLLEDAFTPALVIAAVAWVARSLASQSLSKDLEKYKSELQISANEHSIRYESIHTKRAEVIAKLYALITHTEGFFSDYMALGHVGSFDPIEQRKKAANAAQAMQDYYSPRRLFFEEEVAKSLDDLMKEFFNAWRSFDNSQSIREDDVRESNKLWDDAWNRLQGPVKAIKNELEREFRHILGIST